MLDDKTNARAAIQVASMAGHYEIAIEIADRNGLCNKICIECAEFVEGESRNRGYFTFELCDSGLTIWTCDRCTELFARWIASGGLPKQMSTTYIRTKRA